MNKRQRLKRRKQFVSLWRAVTHGDLRRARKMLRVVCPNQEVLRAAILTGQSSEMIELVRQSAPLSSEELNISLLSQAIADNNLAAVGAYMRSGMSPDTVLDEHGSRPLHQVNSAKMAQLLLAAGADVNGQNRYGEPPIFFAHGEVLQHLLSAGADAAIIGKFRQTALLNYHTAEDIRLLLAAGANPHVLHIDKRTPLHEARDAESVRIYTELGLDVNARDILGNTPLFCPNNPEVAQALLAAGADPRAVNNEGETPLHHCVSAEVAECLIAAGAHVNEEDARGRTPLDYALAATYRDEVQKKRRIHALLKAGATQGSRARMLDIES